MLPGSGINPDHKLLVTKICIQLKKTVSFQEGKPRCRLENLHGLRQEVQDILEK